MYNCLGVRQRHLPHLRTRLTYVYGAVRHWSSPHTVRQSDSLACADTSHTQNHGFARRRGATHTRTTHVMNGGNWILCDYRFERSLGMCSSTDVKVKRAHGSVRKKGTAAVWLSTPTNTQTQSDSDENLINIRLHRKQHKKTANVIVMNMLALCVLSISASVAYHVLTY